MAIRIVELPAQTVLHVYPHSTQPFSLGTLRARDSGTAVDISAGAATLRALIKEHSGDADADAVAELTLSGTAEGVLTATLSAVEAAKLAVDRTYHSSVAVTFAAEHVVEAYRGVTMPAGDIEIRVHAQATRATE